MPASNGVSRHRLESHPLSLGFRAVLFVFVAALVVLEVPGLKEQRTAPDPGIRTQDLMVQSIEEWSPNAGAGIRPGDIIHAVAGQRVRNHTHYRHIVASNHNGSPQEIVLLRDGERRTVTVRYRPARLTFRDRAFPVVAVVFLLVGLWVYLRRPDALGSLFATNCAMLASFLMHRPSTSLPGLQLAMELGQDAVELFFPAVLLHFFLLFPDRGAADAGISRRRLLAVYAPPGTIYLVAAVVSAQRFTLQYTPDILLTVLLAASALYFVLYLAMSLATFVRGYRRAGPAQRQKLRVVIAGSIVGFGPFMAVTLMRSFSPGPTTVLEPIAAVCLVFVPVTFAYAILKHGAIELNAVVRKSLVYAFITAVVVAVYYAVIHFIGEAVGTELGVSNTVLMPVAAVVLALVFAPAREQLQRVVDRLFYRGDFLYKEEVQDFSRQIVRKLTRDELFDCFFERVSALLRTSWIAVYGGDGARALRLERMSGAPPDLPARFSLDCFLGRYLSRFSTPLMVEFLDSTWERPRMDLESKRFLAIPGLSVCVPIAAPDGTVALAVLGEKLSGTTFRRADAELLGTFADQLSLVLQNVDLLESSIEQERLKGEVMLAREIQLSLLPTGPPENDALDMHGQMSSSFEVGGDYFDYLAVDDRRVGVAIGDVSGKGVPAAMLMSSIQAVFKNLALKSRLSPAALNHDLSDYLCENAKPGQFATFFYGIFDLSTSTFTYSSAGHCPGLLMKPSYADRLGRGGLVLGVRRGQAYEEGVVRVEPGDFMLLYTDGVIEQKNDAGEDYGEERLIAFLRAHEKLPLAELQSALIDEVVRFGNGRQDDDLTTLIVRRKAV